MDLLKYIRSNRKGKEAHDIELKAMADPFLQEAIDGYDAVDVAHEEVLNRLQDKVVMRVSQYRKKRILRWSVAASLILFVAVGGLLLHHSTPPVQYYDTIPVAGNLEMGEDGNVAAAVDDSIAIPDGRDTIVQEEIPSRNTAEAEKENAKAIVPPPVPQLTDMIRIVEDDADMEAVGTEEQTAITKTRQRIEFDKNQRIIQGRITDNNKEAVPGVAVTIAHDGKIYTKTATGQDGYFEVRVQDSSVLSASFIGMETQTRQITSDTFYDITMNESTEALSEVVVMGLQKNKSKSKAENKQITGAKEEGYPPEIEDALKKFANYVAISTIAPRDANGNAIKGKVVLEFKVNRRGQPQNIETIVSLTPEADKEAVRLLNNSPEWPRYNKKIKVEISF